MPKNKGITVYIREGVYYQDTPITFSREDSRRKNRPLTFRAFENERVVVSGAKILSNLTWEEHSGAVVKTSVPKGVVFDQLFVNGKLQYMARYEFLGMKLKNITTLGERSAAGIGETAGIWVVEVSKGSPAENTIRPNDIILQINRIQVNNIREMRDALIRTKSKFDMVIYRNQNEMEITIQK